MLEVLLKGSSCGQHFTWAAAQKSPSRICPCALVPSACLKSLWCEHLGCPEANSAAVMNIHPCTQILYLMATTTLLLGPPWPSDALRAQGRGHPLRFLWCMQPLKAQERSRLKRINKIPKKHTPPAEMKSPRCFIFACKARNTQPGNRWAGWRISTTS